MTFDPTKPVQLRDGREARVLCTDLDYSKPIVAAFYTREGSQELVLPFNKDGSAGGSLGDRPYDLINKPMVRYINIWIAEYGYIHCTICGYPTKQAAKNATKYGKDYQYLHIGLEIKI